MTGPIVVTLYASTDGLDTDFTAKLIDVYPDGKAWNLCDGIIRGRYRNGRAPAELLTPGEVYEFTIDCWVTSNVFKKGHAIRLEISSSNFPRFDRNLNTGNPIADDASPRIARADDLSRRGLPVADLAADHSLGCAEGPPAARWSQDLQSPGTVAGISLAEETGWDVPSIRTSGSHSSQDGRVPVPIAEQGHRRWYENRPDDRRIERNRDGETKSHLLERGQLASGKASKHHDHDRRRTR